MRKIVQTVYSLVIFTSKQKLPFGFSELCPCQLKIYFVETQI